MTASGEETPAGREGYTRRRVFFLRQATQAEGSEQPESGKKEQQGSVEQPVLTRRHNDEINPDRELVALSTANLAAGLLRSFAVGGSQSRTLLNSGTRAEARW